MIMTREIDGTGEFMCFTQNRVTRTLGATRAPKLTAPRGCLDIPNSVRVHAAIDSSQRHTAEHTKHIVFPI